MKTVEYHDKAVSSDSRDRESLKKKQDSDFWSACLSILKTHYPVAQYHTWIKPLRITVNRDEIILFAPNRYALDWVRRHCLDNVQSFAESHYQSPISVKLKISHNPDKEKEKEQINSVENRDAQSLESPHTCSGSSHKVRADDADSGHVPAHSSAQAYSTTNLSAEYSFENLVNGRANDMARAAAQQISVNPGLSYNPLFIYGGTGLGKTHLIQAIGNAVFHSKPNARIYYLHATDYVSDFVQAIQQKSFDKFKGRYLGLDLLLIDDIQYFSGKDRTQEEFFYAFNFLVGLYKQIVITCDTYPKKIHGLQERLTSRFGSGLTVEVGPPDLEMRVAILKKKASEMFGDELSDDIAFMIAKNIRSNVRELEGALKRVCAFALFQNKKITIDLARKALHDIIGAHNRQITVEKIQKTVADYYKIKVADMHSHRKSRTVARPRQVAMWLSRELTPFSLPEIGDSFGGRDHTTIMHACKRVSMLRKSDDQFNHEMLVLMQTLKG